jgi:hypothetical protein
MRSHGIRTVLDVLNPLHLNSKKISYCECLSRGSMLGLETAERTHSN